MKRATERLPFFCEKMISKKEKMQKISVFLYKKFLHEKIFNYKSTCYKKNNNKYMFVKKK